MLVANLMSYELWWKVPRWLHRNDLLASKLQNSLLRVDGRLSNSLLPEDVKDQIFLPKNHRISLFIWNTNTGYIFIQV